MYLVTLSTLLFVAITIAVAESTSRDIWQYLPDSNPRIKFYAVPNEYDDHSIKHADLIGSYHGYKDGQVWFCMKGKRLFRAEDDDNFPTPPKKYASEIAMMSPDELKGVLKSYPSYEELHAEYMELYTQRQALDVEKKDNGCTSFICEDSSECRQRSSLRGACDNCDGDLCHFYVIAIPNWIGPGVS